MIGAGLLGHPKAGSIEIEAYATARVLLGNTTIVKWPHDLKLSLDFKLSLARLNILQLGLNLKLGSNLKPGSIALS